MNCHISLDRKIFMIDCYVKNVDHKTGETEQSHQYKNNFNHIIKRKYPVIIVE